MLDHHPAVQIFSEHQLEGEMDQWPLIVVPGWSHLEAEFRDQLAAYADAGGRLLLIGSGPTALFQRELDAAKSAETTGIASVPDVGDLFLPAVRRLLPQPVVEVIGSQRIDVSPRTLRGKLGIHLVNTSGPHADPPPEGIESIPAIGPFKVAIRLANEPVSVIQQPENKPLEVTWCDGRATVTVPQLELYSILEIDQGP